MSTYDVWVNPQGEIVLTSSIANTADDARETSGGSVNTGGTTAQFSQDALCGFRFVAAMPQGVIIRSARIKLAAALAGTGSITIPVHCEAADAAAQYTSTDFSISTRALTTAVVNWTAANDWAVGYAVETPNLAPIVQEVVDRPGFNAVLNFIMGPRTGANRTVAMQDHATLLEPILTVVYEL